MTIAPGDWLVCVKGTGEPLVKGKMYQCEEVIPLPSGIICGMCYQDEVQLVLVDTYPCLRSASRGLFGFCPCQFGPLPKSPAVEDIIAKVKSTPARTDRELAEASLAIAIERTNERVEFLRRRMLGYNR